jgi:hypothetical protein
MMEMVKNTYLANLAHISMDIDRMYMDPEFWYQKSTLDSNAHHLNRHMFDIEQKYMRGDATRMKQTLSSVHRYMNTDLARESLREASLPWMQFGPYMLISMTCQTKLV